MPSLSYGSLHQYNNQESQMFEILSFISESSTSSEQAEKGPRHPTIDVCQATNKNTPSRHPESVSSCLGREHFYMLTINILQKFQARTQAVSEGV
jgi:hypothetical protein